MEKQHTLSESTIDPTTAEIDIAKANVLGASKDLSTFPVVKGYDLNNGVDYDKMFSQYINFGIQCTALGKGINIVNKMINWNLKDDTTVEFDEDDLADPLKRRTKIFLGYTSSCASSGLRDTIRYLCEHKMIDVICTPVTGVDEDLLKCFGDNQVSKFTENIDSNKTINEHKIGNIITPEENLMKYEEWLLKEINEMHDEQVNNKKIWSPSSIVKRLGTKIDNKDSICYWCAKNNIPIYSPAFTDGFMGDVLYKYGKKRPGFIVDLTQDIRGINRDALTAKNTGIIILGGGLIKHHICNANLMRNGANYAVFINTGNEYEASDAGAKPQEA